MKPQRPLLKWIAIAVGLTLFFTFAFVRPSVSARDENTPTPALFGDTSTPTPFGDTSTPPPFEDTSTPTPFEDTATLSPFDETSTPPLLESLLTPDPLPALEIPQENAPQALLFEMQSVPLIAEEWSTQANISYTSSAIQESSKPKIASDINGVEHFVWSQMVNGGGKEIFQI